MDAATAPDATPAPDALDPKGAGWSSSPWLGAGLWLVCAGVAAAAGWGVFFALDGIDNQPENYTLYQGRLSALALLCDVVALVSCAICWNIASRSIRRAARIALITIVAMYVLWYAPIVFGVHRYLLALVGLVAAALMALAPLLALREPRAQRVRWWWLFIVMTGALALAAGVLLSLKLHFLGWTFAID